MKRYTIGAYFFSDMERVLLILKAKPTWQKGLFNFPGGLIEPGENMYEGIAREFMEEARIKTLPMEWHNIGIIIGNGYSVNLLTCTRKFEHGAVKGTNREPVSWHSVDRLPTNIVSNLGWLTAFAFNWHKQGLNGQDKLSFGTFTYK